MGQPDDRLEMQLNFNCGRNEGVRYWSQERPVNAKQQQQKQKLPPQTINIEIDKREQEERQ